MSNKEQLALLKSDVTAWNEWRIENLGAWVNLQKADLVGAKLSEADLHNADLWMANLSTADLSGARLNNSELFEANLCGADLSEANLSEAAAWDTNLRGANLHKAQLFGAALFESNLSDADLSMAKLRSANLARADLSQANLANSVLTGAKLSGANLVRANLSSANLVESVLTQANLTQANLTGALLERSIVVQTIIDGAILKDCAIYGISAWDPIGTPASASGGLIVTSKSQALVTVDDLEIAQFVYLLLSNDKVRHLIDAIASKAVLILGRFGDQRKPTLDALRNALRTKNLTPIVFDFTVPASRNVTETVRTLAGMSRFVLADVTDATEVRAELHTVVPDFPSLPVKPLLLEGKEEFVSLENLKNYPWFLPIFEYRDTNHLVEELEDIIKEPLERTVRMTIDR